MDKELSGEMLLIGGIVVGVLLTYMVYFNIILPDKLSAQCTQLGFEWDKEGGECNMSGRAVNCVCNQEPKQQPQTDLSEKSCGSYCTSYYKDENGNDLTKEDAIKNSQYCNPLYADSNIDTFCCHETFGWCD